MFNRKVIETYYCDINNLADLLSKLVNSYRLLIGGADELNKIALAKKGSVKDALKRADELGEIIDDLVKVLDNASYSYSTYCELKTDILNSKLQAEYIEAEMNSDLIPKE